MQVNGLIVDDLNEKGELKSFVLNKDYKIGDLWIAFPDEYDTPRKGPFHFLDNSYEKLFSSVYENKQIRKAGSNNFREIGNNQFEFKTNWNNIPVRVSWELYYYSLYLPKFAFPLAIDYKLAIRSQYDTNLLKVVKDKDRYVIYIMCKGSEDERMKTPQDLEITVRYEINKELFDNQEYHNLEVNDRPKNHKELVSDYHLFEGNQFNNLEKLLELINNGHQFKSSQKMRLSQVASDVKSILFVLANPMKTTRLRLDEEYREIDHGLRLSNERLRFELNITTATRPNDLRRELLRYKPQYVHFSGHGDTDGIVLENNDGTAQIVKTEALAELFSLFENIVECVILNACYSEAQAEAICNHIPFVIGMNSSVPDNVAIQFAIGFYDGIGAGRDIEDAFRFGKNSVNLNNLSGKDIPQLMKK